MSRELDLSVSYLTEKNNKKQPSLKKLERYANVQGLKKSSILLLTEQLHKAEKTNTKRELIRSLMVR
ncbi:hypothetical protein ACQBEH_11735 [Brevibacillus laterosporus]|uniref:hypothetical protein n=1 Tax=Brevibacillus laterosporus TaxID=1465 RepID=UPI0002150813